MALHQRPLSSANSTFLLLSEGGPQVNVTTVALFEGAPDLQYVARMAEARIRSIPMFDCKITRASHRRFLLEKVPWNASYHVRFSRLETGTEDELQHLATECNSASLSWDMPLWRLQVVENCRGGDAWALVLVVHHALSDGGSWSRVMTRIFDFRPGCMPELQDRTEQERQWELPVHCKRLHWTFRSVLAFLWVALCKVAFFLFSPIDPKTLLLSSTGNYKLGYRDLDGIDELKRVAKAHNASVTALVLSCVARAANELIKSKGGRVPSRTMHAMVPVNVRQPSPEFPTGNEYGCMPVALSPDVRLSERAMAPLRNPHAGFFILMALRITGFLGMRWLVRTLFKLVTLRTSVVFSSVAMTNRPLFCGKSPMLVTYCHPPPPPGTHLGVGLLTVSGNVVLGISVRESIAKNPCDVADLIVAEYAKFKSSLQATPSTHAH